jgi:hypothetical protein
MCIEAVVVSKTVVESTHFGPRVDGKKYHEKAVEKIRCGHHARRLEVMYSYSGASAVHIVT